MSKLNYRNHVPMLAFIVMAVLITSYFLFIVKPNIEQRNEFRACVASHSESVEDGNCVGAPCTGLTPEGEQSDPCPGYVKDVKNIWLP